MKKSKIIQYLAYLTIILILLSILPEVSFAARDSSEHGKGNQDQYMRKDVLNSSNKTNDTDNIAGSESEKEKIQKSSSVKDTNEISDHKQEKTQLKEDLKVHKEEYKEAKEDFLKIRNLVRAGKLEPNSEEALTATKLYFNSSINYMIAHLSNVKSNVAYSNGNGTDDRVTAIDEKVRLLETEKEEVANASNQEELVVIVRSVRGVWNNAEKASFAGAGQIATERIGEFLEKSENISEKVRAKVDNLNETGIETTDLDNKLASYNFRINSARENKEAADAIFNGENVTREDMEKANNYLCQSLRDINKANDIMIQILEELEEYENKKGKETKIENGQDTSLNNTENTASTNSTNSTTVNPESEEKNSSKKEENRSSVDDTENLIEELHN